MLLPKVDSLFDELVLACIEGIKEVLLNKVKSITLDKHVRYAIQ